jgi:hypothetical protein
MAQFHTHPFLVVILCSSTYSHFISSIVFAASDIFRKGTSCVAKRQIGSEKYALYARHIEEDFLKSIHDAQFGICHATGTFAENIRSGKDDGRNEMAISATT